MKEQWVIWSEEHLMWWRPNSRGYTQQLIRAGRYTEEVAKDIEQCANLGCSHPNEVAFKLPDGFDERGGFRPEKRP